MAEDRVVLFVHGFPLDGSMWREAIEALPPGWRGLAPDLRGFGGTEPSAQAAYSMDRFADDLAALLDAEGIGRAVVCGLSMGGYITFAFWRRHRDRVSGLVLADTRAGADSDEARRGRLDLAERIRSEGHDPVVDAMLPKLLSESTRRERTDLVERVEAMMRRVAPAALSAALLGMAERPDATPDLASIDVPTLVVVGEEDAITPPAEAEKLAAGIEGARLVRVEGAGHLAPVEKPEVFGRALGEWIAAVG